MEEEVLVITKSSIEKFGFDDNVLFGDEDNFNAFCYLLGEAHYRNRKDVEDDFKFVQLIPYCVFANRNSKGLQILVYNRGDRAGESRLAKKWSIGVGGHINPQDGLPSFNTVTTASQKELEEGMNCSFDIITTAAKRELEEEMIGLDASNLRSLVPHGVFYSDATEVSKVHLGIFFLAVGDKDSFSSMGDHIEEYRWETIEGLREYTLEDWSQVVLNELLSLVV